MQFTFKRDEEGRERIYVGDVLVAGIENHEPLLAYAVAGVTYGHIAAAIGRADEAGFWERLIYTTPEEGPYMDNEVTVDVPVAETSTTLTLVSEEGDEA